MTAMAALLAAVPALAAPQGGSVVAGSATIAVSGTTTNINQSTNSAIINWMSFSIAPKETVNFNQPSSTSVTLNRVIGNEQSIIAGALNANGQVFIVNSAGVVFTKDAQVNVGGIVGSTLDISNQNFMAGNYTFSGASMASIVNNGHITAAPGGYVSLLGNTVSNNGVISARLGTVTLASGQQMTLNFGGNSLVDVTIDQGTYNALVANKGLIKADGGHVIMTAKAADAVLSAQVNNSGIVQARTIGALTGGGSGGGTHVARRRGTMQIGAIRQAHNGSGGTLQTGAITLIADGGTVNVSGTLDASAPRGGQGGTIETSGNTVKIADSAIITTKAANGQNGNWIIDPDGFTIAATGGDMTGATLSSELASNNITILSTQGSGNGGLNDGNLNVNAAVSWSANTTLTLEATNNININSPITATGASAGLVLDYGGYAANGTVTAGTNYNIDTTNGAYITLPNVSAAGSLTINGQAYTPIQSMASLAGISGSSGFDFLGQSLNATSAGTYNAAVVTTFSGTLAGLGNTISNLSINAPTTNFVGLIGKTNTGSAIRDLTLTNISINPTTNPPPATLTSAEVGGLVGEALGGTIGNISIVGGTITGMSNVGGIVGLSEVSINNSTSSASVIGTLSGIGGLVGFNFGANGKITSSSDTGNVTAIGSGGIKNIGGLAGESTGTITNSSATGTLTATVTQNGANGYTAGNNIGGLVGENSGTITGSTASVILNVQNSANVGGFVGNNSVGSNVGTISASSANAPGSVNVTFTVPTSSLGLTSENIGGFAGNNPGTITNSTASENISVTPADGTTTSLIADVGGFVGLNGPDVSYNGSINGSTTNGTVTTSNSTNVGGFAGNNAANASITNSNSSGSVSGTSSVGGFVGDNAGNIGGSGTSSNVSGSSNVNVGGFDGSNQGGISNSSGTGSVSQPNGTEAFSGNNIGTVTNSTYTDVAGNARAQAAAATLATDRQAAQGANASMGLTQVTAIKPPDPVAGTAAGNQAITALGGPKIDDAILNTPPATTSLPTEQQRRRRVVNTTPPPRRATGNGAGGAAIRSIEINGQRYRLER